MSTEMKEQVNEWNDFYVYLVVTQFSKLLQLRME